MRRLNLLVLFLFLTAKAYGAVLATKPIGFSKGVNLKTSCSQIDDEEACDMDNMVNDTLGAAFKRSGSKFFISQAFSSMSVTSLYRSYGFDGVAVKKHLLASIGDSIVVSTKEANSPAWVVLSSGNPHNQSYSYATILGKTVIAGDSLKTNLKMFDNVTSSVSDFANFPGTDSIALRAKYVFNTRDYLLAGNVVRIPSTTLDTGTTYYAARMYYSLYSKPSSFTAERFIDFGADDGQELTGFGEMNKFVQVFKTDSIYDIDYTILNLRDNGGDIVVKKVVDGFGCIAPGTLVNIGDYYIFLSKDGVRLWDGGRRARLNLGQESTILSGNVEPIISRMTEAGTYKGAKAVYYPKKQWYVLSYEDPDRLPRGQNNSILVFDVKNGSWFPFSGWLAQSLETFDGPTDNGEFVYGDGQGHVYFADDENSPDDARREVVVNNMDVQSDWARGIHESSITVEGTASVKMPVLSASILQTSVTWMKVVDAGSWLDGSLSSATDRLSFKVYVSSLQNLSSLRIDLEMRDLENDFDTDFTSVTISSNALTAGNTAWSTVEISLSSFPLKSTWVELSSEALTFADSPTYYGIRFVANGIAGCTVYLDDLRRVESGNAPIKAHRTTKQFVIADIARKSFKKLYLTVESTPESVFYADIYKDFGEFSNRVTFGGSFGKELFAAGYGNVHGVTKLDSVDYSVIDATLSAAPQHFAIRPIVTDDIWVYGGDQYNHKIWKIPKSSMSGSVLISSYGSLGTGSTNFNIIYQIACDYDSLYVCDLGNHRIKRHSTSNLAFIESFGELGRGATNFHNPTGVAVDERYLYVAQDGNYLIQKFNKADYTLANTVKLNLNTIGDTTLAVDEKYLYVCYEKIPSKSLQYLDVILEKYDKGSLRFINSVKLATSGAQGVFNSTYSKMGDIGLQGDYIFVSFATDLSGNPRYYVQKRLKSDFSIVSEFSSSQRQYAVSANGLSWLPQTKLETRELAVESTYLQLNYYDDSRDNRMKLHSQSFSLEPQVIQ